MPPRRIVLLAFPDAQSLDFVGPLEVFGIAERLAPGRYSVEVVAPSAEPFATNSGLTVAPDRSTAACRGPIDTLVVAGGLGVRAAMRDESLVRWVARAAERSRRVTSVCTGAFLLAEAGLLDGRRVATHWASTRPPGTSATPAIDVDPESIFVRDGDVWTSAGVTAGMDLALALVEDDLGPEAALEVARWLVLYVKRPGGQSQFSAALAAQTAERAPLREVQEWVRANPRSDCSVEALAARAPHEPAQLLARVLGRGGHDARRLGRGVARGPGQGPSRDHLRHDGGRGRGVRLRHRRDAAARFPRAAWA